MRHFLRDDDISADEQAEILRLAQAVKAEPFSHRPLEGPRSVAVIFDKASTRTRVSFAAGIAELGGYPMMIDSSASQADRGEPTADTARVLGRQASAIVWRTYAHSALQEMADYAGVPVINALSDDAHPCQVLADWLTLLEHFGELAGLRIAYVGDGSNNMAHSYLLGGATAGMQVRLGVPEDYLPRPDIVADAAAIASATGGSVQVLHDPVASVADADVLITDTWVSMGQEAEREQRLKTFAPYALTAELLEKANPDAVVLHCLPAYRGLEIAAEVLDGPQSLVWDEAENRRHAQKALLIWLLAQSESSDPGVLT